ncbi:hypothetical protein [Hellea balneolensis]|uniref:hypothetical protein n=1 Tax=Hellea balneolensis TaxID=287478 RepID=UPI0003FA6CAC|nr:hypothetical protein [Hellea balneolensis]
MKFLMTTAAIAAMALVPQAAQAQLFGGLDNGTLLGGTVGAGLGGAIGSNLAGSGQRDEGTAIGAVVGGLAGAAYANSRSNYYGNPYAGQFNPGFNGRNLIGAGVGAGLGGVIGSNLAGTGVQQEGTAIGALLGGAAGYALANRGSSRYGNLGPQGGFGPGPIGGSFGPVGPGFNGGPVPVGPGFSGGPAFGAPSFGAPAFGAPSFGAPGFGGPAMPSAPIMSGPQFINSGQFISGPIIPVTRYVQPAPQPIIMSQPRTVYTAPVSTSVTYAAPNMRLAGPPIRPTVIRRTITVEPAPTVRAQRVVAEPANCPSGTTLQSDGSCLEQTITYATPEPAYTPPAPVIADPYVAPQMADCPAGTTQQSDGTCMEQSVTYSAPAPTYTAPAPTYAAPQMAGCPSGTTAQSDGTCLSSAVTSYAPSYNNSSSVTTSYRAPTVYSEPTQMYQAPSSQSHSGGEYCYAGGSKRYDSLGREIKKGDHDHCRNH